MSNPTCYPKKTLKQYVAGWTDADESSVIEAHLSECEICEKTLSELEGDPETLLEFLHGRVNPTADSSPEKPASSPGDALVSYALSKSKQLGHERREDTPDQPHALPSPIPTSLGPYDLLRPIGQGSMGRVYLARHRQLGKLVAVKVLASRAFRSDEYARRFEREVRAAGALQHPSIINATDAGQADCPQGNSSQNNSGLNNFGRTESVHYLVMEYIEGLDLSRLLRTVGPLSIANACAIGQAIAMGLDHAHAAGIVHRDIKPSNVMLSLTGQVKLLDFGLAQATMWDEASAELTTVGQLMGTIDYMAPEQAERAESVDYRADLYALGATLFRVLCGRAPLAASPNLSPLARLRLLATSAPPALRTLRPDAPLELERLIYQLLSRDPDARPASAAHVAEQLATLAEDANLSALVCTAQKADPVVIDESIDESTTAHAIRPAVAARSNQPPNRVRRLLMAAAAGALACAAIVWITLETQKGQVVIESLDANVTVQLSKNGQVHQSLTVVPGANSTRIEAGQYDVSIAAGSDQFGMDRETLEIKRGQTVIARVRQLPKPDATSASPSQSPNATVPNATATSPDALAAGPAPGADEKVFDGNTLSTWRRDLIRERSLAAIIRSLDAIDALADESERSDIIQEFLIDFPTHLPENDQYVVYAGLFKIARDAPTYVQSIVATLPKVDDRQARQILFLSLLPLYQDQSGVRKDLVALEEPLAQWSANFLRKESNSSESAKPARLQLREEAGYTIVKYVNKLCAAGLNHSHREQELVDVLTDSKLLDQQFWLNIIPERNKPLSAALAMALEDRATTYFIEDDDPTSMSATTATLHLLAINNNAYDWTRTQPIKKRAEIVEAIRRRLKKLIDKPAVIYNLVDIGQTRRDLISYANNKTFLSPKFGFGASISYRNGSHTYPCLDLLYLAKVLNAGSELSAELNDLLFNVKKPLFQFATSFQGSHNINLNIDFPQISARSEHSSVLNPEPRKLVTVIPTAQQVMAAFVYSRIDELMPSERQVAFSKELWEAVKTMWIQQQISKYDSDGNGKLEASELMTQFQLDADEDQVISHKELQTFYEGFIDNGRPRGK